MSGKSGIMVVVVIVVFICLVFQYKSGCYSQQGTTGQDYTMPRPPAKAGSLDTLENTVWEVLGGKLKMLPGGAIEFSTDDDPDRLYVGQYTLSEEGFVRLYAVGTPLKGVATWDGEKLVLEGDELKPFGQDGATNVGPAETPPVAN